MRKLYWRFEYLMQMTILFSVISSVSVLLCILPEINNTFELVIRIILPVVFWGGLIAELIFWKKANSLRKEFEKSNGFMKIKGKPGVFSVMQTKYGKIADIVFVVSLFILIILTLLRIGEKVLQYIFIFLLVLSFRLHCILNGKNFRYIKHLSTRKVEQNV